MMRRLLTPLLLTLLLVCSCHQRDGTCSCPDRRKLDERLMLVLASARALHHQADILAQQGLTGPAERKVAEILKLDLNSRWPEAEDARLDAAARLAKMMLAGGRVDEAFSLIKQGIDGATRESFYLSNLFGVQGEVLEQKVKALDAAGSRAEAKKAAREAMDAYERSITINKRLQQKLLEGRSTP